MDLCSFRISAVTFSSVIQFWWFKLNWKEDLYIYNFVVYIKTKFGLFPDQNTESSSVIVKFVVAVSLDNLRYFGDNFFIRHQIEMIKKFKVVENSKLTKLYSFCIPISVICWLDELIMKLATQDHLFININSRSNLVGINLKL